MKTVLITLRALVVTIAFCALWIWIARAVQRYDAELGVALPAWVRPMGILVGLAGMALALACVGTFIGRGRGTPAPFDPPRVFVAAGPYHHVRNPMYVGGFLALVGFALYQRSLSILLFSFGWLLLFHAFVLWYEEPTLKEKFGLPYEQYLKTVPRWLPRVQRS